MFAPRLASWVALKQNTYPQVINTNSLPSGVVSYSRQIFAAAIDTTMRTSLVPPENASKRKRCNI
jgi:hypothetical protein